MPSEPDRFDAEDILRRLKKIETRIADQARDVKPLETKKFNTYGRVLPAFNRKNIKNEVAQIASLKASSLIPKAVTNLDAKVDVISVNGRSMNRLTVTWINPSDPNYDGARVWFKGYQTDNELVVGGGNSTVPFVLWAEVQDSPYTTNVEATGEEIQITVQAINKDRRGADLKTLPTVRATLSLDPRTPDSQDEKGITLF